MARSSAGAARSGCGGWALWSFPVCMDDELSLQEGVDWQSLPLLVQLSGSTAEQPKPTAIVWFTPPAVAAISQIRSKCSHPSWTAARCNHWKYFFCGSRCSHSAQHSGLVKKTKTVTLFNCAPSDLTNSEFYHVQSKDRRALGKFPSLWPVRNCWALGFSSRI